MKPEHVGGAYLFDRFVLDLRGGRLLSGESEIELRPKSFQILCYLLDNAGRLISKEELIRVAWPNVIVTDDALTKCIGDIRAALGDAEQTIVKTVPRRGYVLITPVSRREAPVVDVGDGTPRGSLTQRDAGASNPDEAVLNSPESERTADASGQSVQTELSRLNRASKGARSWRTVAALLGVLLFVGLYALLKPTQLEDGGSASIAVLPLLNLSGDPSQEYFGDGLSEDLTTALSRFPGLVVTAPNSAFKYKTQRPEPSLIGRDLSVRYLLDGSVRRDGERLRVTVRLIDTRAGTQLWAEQYERHVGDLFVIKDDITTKIVVSLVNQVSKSELERSLRKPPETLAAWDHYVRGTAVLRNFTAGDRGPLLVQARQHFRQALTVDPRYAPAMQALAQTFTAAWLEPATVEPIKSEYQKSTTLDQGRALAEQAIEIDPYLAEAYSTLAWILHWQYQRPAGIAAFRRALELNPNLAEGRFSLMLTHAGHAKEGIEEMQRIMRLDPHHPALYWTWLGNAHYLIGNNDLALRALRIAASRQPKHRPTHVWLAAAAAMAGDSAEARRASEIVLQLQPDFTISRFLQLLRLTLPTDSDRLAQGLRLAGLPD